jgi:hypothetical protein
LKTSLVCGAVAAGLLTAPAIAADLPLKAPPYVAPIDYNWTGWFVGANAGGAWARSDVSSNFSCPAGGLCSVNVPANLANVTNAAMGTLSTSGFTGGGQLGYNWQSGALVYGVETDFNALDLRIPRRLLCVRIDAVGVQPRGLRRDELALHLAWSGRMDLDTAGSALCNRRVGRRRPEGRKQLHDDE